MLAAYVCEIAASKDRSAYRLQYSNFLYYIVIHAWSDMKEHKRCVVESKDLRFALKRSCSFHRSTASTTTVCSKEDGMTTTRMEKLTVPGVAVSRF